jgi:hypothetical protein
VTIAKALRFLSGVVALVIIIVEDLMQPAARAIERVVLIGFKTVLDARRTPTHPQRVMER